MKNRFTIIKLKPNISTIDYEQFNKANEPVTSNGTSETNLLTKTGNFTRFPPEKGNIINQIKQLPKIFCKKNPRRGRT